MKAKYILTGIFALLFSCTQSPLPVGNEMGEEIILDVSSGFEVDTKASATAVTTIPSSLYWGMTYSNGSGKQSTTSKSVSDSKISTGYYQTASPTTYIHYVANTNFTTGGNMSVANNSTDIVAGKVSSNSATPSVTLNHIFARTGSFTCNAQSGYNISGVSWTITGYGSVTGTAGTFSMASQTWTARSAALGETAVSGSSDLYLIPGEYTIKVSYTLSKGDYSKSFTKSGRVTLEAGKINNVSCTAIGGDAQSIVVGVSLSAWTSTSHSMSIS